MPIAVISILDQLGLSLSGHARWSQDIPSKKPGIYFVSLSDDANSNSGILPEAPISMEAVRRWLTRVPSLTLNSVLQPSAVCVGGFLRRFWLPDENIVYIGKASGLHARLSQFFRHRLGDPGPHAGGHWLKTLSCVERLHVYFSECASVQTARANESSALDVFMDQVTEETKALVFPPHLPIPFANREHPPGKRKQSCLRHEVLA